MPIPFIPLAVAALIALFAGSAVWIYESAKGKRITVLGPRKSGKTTLATFLETGEIPEGYTPTQTPRPFDENVKFKDLEFKVHLTDLSGDKSAWGVWRKESQEADLVCFLAAWPSLEAESEWEAVSRAAQQVGSWELSAKTVLIITFSDLAPGQSSDAVLSTTRVKQLRRSLGNAPALCVDQTDEAQRMDLGYQILELLK